MWSYKPLLLFLQKVKNAEVQPKNLTSRIIFLNLFAMKRLIITILTLIFAISLFGNDVVTLNNQMMFEGKILRIDDCELVFRSGMKRHYIPAEDIYSIQFRDVNSKIYQEYLNNQQGASDKCFMGRTDAQNFHGKEVGHFVLGMLFGPFAMIGTAISNPTPEKGSNTYAKSQNREHFSDPAYLECYRKKVKRKNIGIQAAGWGTWILILLLL